MKNTSKVKIYLISSYSNYNPNLYFITGSDKVALSLSEIDPENSVVIGPSTISKILPSGVKFIPNQKYFIKNIFFDYIIRTIKTYFILKNLGKGNNLVSSSDFFCDVIPAYLNRKGNNWFVFTYHLYPSFKVNYKLRDLFGKMIQDFSFYMYRSADRIFTSNFECVEYLKNKFNYSSNVTKIPLGVNLNEYYTSSEKSIDILFLGRIKESKGVFELPEIVSLVRRELPSASVVLIGNGPDKEKSEIYKLNDHFKSKIKFLGSVSDKEVKETLAKTKILIQLDSENGFGLNIVEALASGCYVVGYDLPSYRDNFKELGLIMSNQKDKVTVSNNIIRILKNYSKPKLDTNFLKRFDWKHIFSLIFG